MSSLKRSRTRTAIGVESEIGAKRRRNPFIDDEAGESEQEDDWESETGEETSYVDEEEEVDDLEEDHHLNSNERQLAPNESAEDFHVAAVRTANKYRAVAAANGGQILEDNVSEQAIIYSALRLPTVGDTALWRVHVNVGQERDIVHGCLLRALKFLGPPRISAAFESSKHIPGSVYIEAYSYEDVKVGIKGLHGVYIHRSIEIVPIEERPALLDCCQVNIAVGAWVRVGGKGLYHDDLAYVVNVDQAKNTATVRLVPRLKPESCKGQEKQTRCRIRPTPCLFWPDLFSSVEELGNGRFMLNKEVFIGGLREMEIPEQKLHHVFPSVEELVIFASSQGIEIPVMSKALSESAARVLKPGDPVRITSGEQKGLTGTMRDAIGSIMTVCPSLSPEHPIEIPFSSVCLNLRVGDYILVKSGHYAGRKGWVTDVTCRDDGDTVTFVDELIKITPPEDFQDLYNNLVGLATPEEMVVSAYFVEIHDLPLELPFFANGILSQDASQNPTVIEVSVIGAHRFSGRKGITCGPAKFNNSGVHSYIVELEPDKSKVSIPTIYLTPSNRFLIGGCVAIKGGIYKGKKGRVCRIEGMWGQTVIVEVPGDGKVTLPRGDVDFLTGRRHEADVPLGSLGDPDFKKVDLKHPSIGTLVTVSGRHEFCGLHGSIYDATKLNDKMEPQCFSVYLEAKSRMEIIRREFLTLRKGENHSPWALNFFKSSPAVETPLATIPPPSLPPVPLTPLPEAVISGGSVSPAWDPSSRTPPGHVSEHQEPSDGDVPLHRQIPKPKGKLNRSKGYNLKQSLLWDEPLYTEIKNYICKLAFDHFDLRRPLGKQEPGDRELVFSEAKKKYAILKNYRDNWPTRAFVEEYLKITNQRLKRHASTGQ